MTLGSPASTHAHPGGDASVPGNTPARPAAAPSAGGPALRWSWKLITVVGIDVYIHGTFLLLVAFVAFSSLLAGKGPAAMTRTTLLIIAVFTTVVLHELGHALTARRFGVRTRDITLLPIGGISRLERMPDNPRQQLLIALSGPAVNLAIAFLLFGLLRLLDGQVGVDGFLFTGGPFIAQLMWINVSLAVFNLLPGYPMDGGRTLRALLAMRMAPEQATQTAARIGQGMAVIFGLAGLFFSPLLMVIAVFVWLGAQAEHSISTVKVALAGLPVRHGMITDFKTLSPADTLSRAVELTLAGFQQDFPVLDGPRLVGVLTHGDVLRGLAGQGANLPVKEAMQSRFETASPSEGLNDALTRIHQEQLRALVVVENEKVVGLLTLGNIGELMAMEAASHRTGAADARLHEERSGGINVPSK
jgi:Zn-dependent protease/CBS domain-containing protein